MNKNTILTDLICGMEVNSDDISLDYQGFLFHAGKS